MNKNIDYRMSFETFKSNVNHYIKDQGELEFILWVYENNRIPFFWEKKWYPECFYLLAMVDYLSKQNDIELCSDFNYIRQFKLDKPMFPRDINITASLDSKLDMKMYCIEHAIPEFKKYNLIEMEVKNVF